MSQVGRGSSGQPGSKVEAWPLLASPRLVPEQDSTSPRGASSPQPPRLGSGWLEMEGQGERCAVT